MKFVRLIVCSFDFLSPEWFKWATRGEPLSLGTMGHWEKDKEHHLLVGCQVDVTGGLTLTGDREIVIPSDVLRDVETALEQAANTIAVFQTTRRHISSPMPCAALVPANAEEKEWLESTRGMQVSGRSLHGARYDIDESLQSQLQGREDGVALLSEALAHTHPTGSFHEFLRLFERAFHLSSTPLAEPLGAFLAGAHQGFSIEEAQRWVVELRHPATHADRRDEFLLERGIRPVVRRMEQAAYDVLFNKAVWRDPSTERRDVWRPNHGSLDPEGTLFIVPDGRDVHMEGTLIDDFGSYPINLTFGIEKGLPEEFWTRFARPSVNLATTATHVVEPPEGKAATEGGEQSAANEGERQSVDDRPRPP